MMETFILPIACVDPLSLRTHGVLPQAGDVLFESRQIFGSDRSSGSHDVRMSVRLVQTCLEQSISIILAKIFKQSVRNKSAVSEHSEHQNKSQYSQSL